MLNVLVSQLELAEFYENSSIYDKCENKLIIKYCINFNNDLEGFVLQNSELIRSLIML